MNIALSFSTGSESYSNYSTWLNEANPEINIIHLDQYAIEDIEHILKTCSGIVFTGGSDINPSFYGQIERLKDNDGVDVSLSGQPLSFSVVDTNEELNRNKEINIDVETTNKFSELNIEENKEEEE